MHSDFNVYPDDEELNDELEEEYGKFLDYLSFNNYIIGGYEIEDPEEYRGMTCEEAIKNVKMKPAN